MNVQQLLRDDVFLRKFNEALVRPLLTNPPSLSDRSFPRECNVVGYAIGRQENKGIYSEDLCLIVYVDKAYENEDITADRKLLRWVAVDPENPRLGHSDLFVLHRQNKNDIPGIPIEVRAVGTPTANALPPTGALTGQQRPICGGLSVGCQAGSARKPTETTGTLGCFVRDRKPPHSVCLLTASHVLNDFDGGNDASPGDPVVQPGFIDGAKLAHPGPGAANYLQALRGNTDFVAQYVRGVPAKTPNKGDKFQVDAAIASLDSQHSYQSRIYGEIGGISRVGTPRLGDMVQKVGRTTGMSYGKITSTIGSFSVSFGSRNVTFTDLISTSLMSRPGDSGSILVTCDRNEILGLLIGSTDANSLFCKIDTVMDLLEVDLL